MTERPRVVLFVCTHNAGRSALAAAIARTHFGARIDATSAGVNPQQAPSKVTIASLAELGIDDSHHVPSALTPERVATADLVVAMKPGLDIPQPTASATRPGHYQTRTVGTSTTSEHYAKR